MTEHKENSNDYKIICLVQEAMKSGVSKEAFSLFLKNKALEKKQ